MFCFSIVAQRPRVSPPFRLGAADGLLVSLVHGLMRTACDEQNQHWYCIMDFGSHTSGSDMAECRAPADERRKKMVRERQNHNGGKQQGASSSAAGSANPKVGKGAKTGKRKQPLEGKQQGTGKGMKRFPSSRSVRALCRHPDVASPMGCINACAQQGTVLQRHAPLRFLPIETRSLRASRNGFM